MNPTLIFGGVLILTIIILLAWIVRLEIRIARLLRGKQGGDLEDTIISNAKGLHDARVLLTGAEKRMDEIDTRLKKSIQSVRTVRFDAFSGGGYGGKQSFATAFLDEKGNGVVISSLYGRDKVGVFAKTVESYNSPHELTDEEREALGKK